MRVCKVKIEDKTQPKHDLNLCAIFFLSPVGGKTCYGFAMQLLAAAYCMVCYKNAKKLPDSALMGVYVLCDSSYIVVDLK